MLLSLGWIQALTLLIAAKLESRRWSWLLNIAHWLEVIWTSKVRSIISIFTMRWSLILWKQLWLLTFLEVNHHLYRCKIDITTVTSLEDILLLPETILNLYIHALLICHVTWVGFTHSNLWLMDHLIKWDLLWLCICTVNMEIDNLILLILTCVKWTIPSIR